MIVWFRRKLLETIRPLSLFLSKIGIRFGHGHISHSQVEEVAKRLKPGSIILTRINGEISNALIPGFYTHAAIAVSKTSVVEALYPKVKLTNIFDLLMSKNHAVIVEPLFADEVQMNLAAEEAYNLIGFDYDMEFEPNNRAFYCSEIIWYAYSFVVKNMPFLPRERLGVLTVTPQDIYNAKTKFKEIYKCD